MSPTTLEGFVGQKYATWNPLTAKNPSSFSELTDLIRSNRGFIPPAKLDYGDHGLGGVIETIATAIENEQRIALYADYDVDGTMSCVSWIWFFQEIGFENFVHYIPCRFKEGYGLNLKAIRHLVENEKAEVIITMDTGITANEEAAYCKEQGVAFICTDHHKIQPEKMPDSLILNPKLHPDPMYQELCGCGITFVLLRKLGQIFPVNNSLWNDLLALAGMATICDVVPLNGVNHRLARMGVDALLRSQKPVLQGLREACSLELGVDEKDVGFRLGPRINAVGRLDHADLVVKAFLEDDPTDLIRYMSECNDRRRLIQDQIVKEAIELASARRDDPVLFLGGDWHTGVVGIAASKLAEKFWRPTWLFQRKDGICKGSARSVPGFDVTEAMAAAGKLFTKFGGHRAAGGFTFPAENEAAIREALIAFANTKREKNPEIWQSQVNFDCTLPTDLIRFELLPELEGLKPFGHGFEEPKFCIEASVTRCDIYNDKTTGDPRHTFVTIQTPHAGPQKIKFFNEVHDVFQTMPLGQKVRFLVSVEKDTYRGKVGISLQGHDFSLN